MGIELEGLGNLNVGDIGGYEYKSELFTLYLN